MCSGFRTSIAFAEATLGSALYQERTRLCLVVLGLHKEDTGEMVRFLLKKYVSDSEGFDKLLLC